MKHRTLLQTDEDTRFTWCDVFTVTPHVFRRLMTIRLDLSEEEKFLWHLYAWQQPSRSFLRYSTWLAREPVSPLKLSEYRCVLIDVKIVFALWSIGKMVASQLKKYEQNLLSRWVMCSRSGSMGTDVCKWNTLSFVDSIQTEIDRRWWMIDEWNNVSWQNTKTTVWVMRQKASTDLVNIIDFLMNLSTCCCRLTNFVLENADFHSGVTLVLGKGVDIKITATLSHRNRLHV